MSAAELPNEPDDLLFVQGQEANLPAEATPNFLQEVFPSDSDSLPEESTTDLLHLDEDSDALPEETTRSTGRAVVDGVLRVQTKHELTLYCEGITTITVGSGVCNDPAICTWRLEPFQELQVLQIGDKSFRYLEELKMEGMKFGAGGREDRVRLVLLLERVPAAR